MARLTVNSHMSSFRLIHRITGVSNRRIEAVTAFVLWPVYTGLEAMAQLAALHVRHSLAFERHAFLLKVDRCDLPEPEALDGEFFLTADRISQSSQTFAYQVAARGPEDVAVQGQLLIGTQDYDGRFRKDRLKQHYLELFEALCNRQT